MRFVAKKYLAVRNFFSKKEEGATMAEYGMLLALIAVALVVAIGLFKDAILAAFTAATGALTP